VRILLHYAGKNFAADVCDFYKPEDAAAISAFQRFLENQMREEFEFIGTPLRFVQRLRKAERDTRGSKGRRVTPASTATRRRPARIRLSPSQETGNMVSDGAATQTEKEFYRIGDVSKITALKPFRFALWETEFPMLQPVKSPSGHRALPSGRRRPGPENQATLIR